VFAHIGEGVCCLCAIVHIAGKKQHKPNRYYAAYYYANIANKHGSEIAFAVWSFKPKHKYAYNKPHAKGCAKVGKRCYLSIRKISAEAFIIRKCKHCGVV